MIQRMSDEKLLELKESYSIPIHANISQNQFNIIFRQAESIYIPQLEKMQEQLTIEINSADKRYHDMMEWKEKWLASNHSLELKDAVIDELKQGVSQMGLSITIRDAEIERLKELGYTTLNDYREESKMRIEAEKELQQMSAKHERLVKGLKEIQRYNASINDIETISFKNNTNGYWMKASEVLHKLTESEGE